MCAGTSVLMLALLPVSLGADVIATIVGRITATDNEGLHIPKQVRNELIQIYI